MSEMLEKVRNEKYTVSPGQEELYERNVGKGKKI